VKSQARGNNIKNSGCVGLTCRLNFILLKNAGPALQSNDFFRTFVDINALNERKKKKIQQRETEKKKNALVHWYKMYLVLIATISRREEIS
jgi:hypothetical protein